MKLVISQQPARRMLRSAQVLLTVCAVTLLSYCAYVLTDTWAFQRRERQELEGLLTHRRVTTEGIDRTVPSVLQNPLPTAVASGLIGRIEVTRLGMSAIVMEGTSRTTLRRAIGHIAGTALPGQPGNVGLSGHRDTFFRQLQNIRQDDIVTFTTMSGEFRYRVVSTRVVAPTEISVLEPGGDEILTLVTCYPFYYAGPAPNRFIVRAQRVS